MAATLADLRCGKAPKAVLEYIHSLLNDDTTRAKALRTSRVAVPLHEDKALRKLLQPWVAGVIKGRGTIRKGVRLGRGPTSATMFPTCAGRVGRTGGGKLLVHQDYNPMYFPGQEAWSLIVLTKPVRTTADGPTVVYPGTSSLDLDAKHRARALQSCTAIELKGEAGDAFVFAAADYHEVLPVRPAARVSTRATRGGISSAPPSTASGDEIVRCNLVVGAWTAGLDNKFTFED